MAAAPAIAASRKTRQSRYQPATFVPQSEPSETLITEQNGRNLFPSSANLAVAAGTSAQARGPVNSEDKRDLTVVDRLERRADHGADDDEGDQQQGQE